MNGHLKDLECGGRPMTKNELKIKKLEQENKQLKEKQKKFIKWLEEESQEVIRDAGYHQRICEDILEKYKGIIGSDK